MEKNSYIFVNNPTDMKNILLKTIVGLALTVLAFQVFLIALCVFGQDELLSYISHFLIY